MKMYHMFFFSGEAEGIDMGTRSGFPSDESAGYAPTTKIIRPVKKIVEYVKQQPYISYAAPIPIKKITPILQETKSTKGYGYGQNRDILSAPMIPLGMKLLL